jgi:hypothetical protein
MLSDSGCSRSHANVPGSHLRLVDFRITAQEITGTLQGTAQLPFSLLYFAFPATMIVTGALLPKIGPRRCAVIGGALGMELRLEDGHSLDLKSNQKVGHVHPESN